jgi:hypothetical protein
MAVSKAIPAKSPLPILENFLFDLKGTTLEITASDTELTLRTKIEVEETAEEGKIAVPAKHMMDLLKELPDQPLTIGLWNFSAGFDDGVSSNLGRYAPYQDESDWREVQLFKFGLMSYLLPRYLVMMNSAEELYEDYSQWTGNNSLPADPLTGQTYSNWRELQRKATSDQSTDLAHVANVPSQAVCSRWMPNLEGICSGNGTVKLFGVTVTEGTAELRPGNKDIEVFSPGGFDSDSTSGQYVLDCLTVKDGWRREFFYYSPAPYQSYVLWSAGANGKTFPPWVSRDELSSQANECIGLWIEDDIVSMSN